MRDNLDRFRAEIRAWLDSNCPIAMRSPMISDDDVPWGGRQFQWGEAQRQWLTAMAARGWTVPTWPIECGGASLGRERADVLKFELQRIGARPPLFNYGISMLAPALLKYGSEAQQIEHLPKIARGEIRWCQGYSEPGAGSDLASLTTRADDKGDHFLVTGQKIWTSYANNSDWMFCLVRTNREAPKHLGISFLLVDMASPGIRTQPIKLISGKSRFCETRFESVRVPKENLVGEINAGWSVAKFLLSHERDTISNNDVEMSSEFIGQRAVKKLGVDANGCLEDHVLRSDIARADLNGIAFDALLSRTRGVSEDARDLSSVLKYLGAELSKRRRDLMLKVEGYHGLEWDWDDLSTGTEARAWLYSRGDSIKGGTNEIQLGIISRRLLGLPSPRGEAVVADKRI